MSTPKSNFLVSDVMMSLNRVPVIGETVIFKEALAEMGRKRLGIACIVNAQNKLLGILTDGDVRRMLLRVQKPFSAFFVDDALDHAAQSPLTIAPGDTLVQAVRLMDEKHIWDLPVVDAAGVLVGLLHLHPAVEALLGIEG
jgi:DeoR family transcriptional regulator, catabolite repression regulator